MQDLRRQEVTYLPGIGPSRAKILEKYLNITTWHDLLYYFPYKHIDRSRLYRISELSEDMPFVQVKGQFLSFEESGVGRKKHLTAHFTDGSMVMDLVWFNGIKYIEKSIKLREDYIVFGRPTSFNGRININHPDVDKADSLSLSKMGMQPYYTVPEGMKKAGLSSRSLEHFTSTLFQQLDGTAPETLPSYLREQYQLMPLGQALRAAHYPNSAEELSKANFRLKFEELFYIQLSILRYARERQNKNRGQKFLKVGPLFSEFYHKRLPFDLTNAQKRVVREMHQDMKMGKQMNRLLQGDVGSGKTMVAMLSMLLALDNGCQSCIMAPTEILAEQHMETFASNLQGMNIRVELLTGMVKGKKRKEILEGLKQGDVHILVGTHALIEDNVVFKNLGLVVIDEQHRFGVAQRARLWHKNTVSPHVLVMTATPIPRTLAMTLYGDLDVSVIDELPPGRKPVKTIHQYDNRMDELYELVGKQLAEGRQVYVVYPLVKESDKVALKNVEDGFEHWKKSFPMYNVSMVHGQMKGSEKDEQMQLFVQGKTRILVATTVIEVGVNVPNASVMVIENAERFGLSQLHQLRGRVGRGADQSFCILVTGFELSKETRKRIQIMTETNDGFEISEADLKLRGPGDLEGTQQSGVAFDLKIANLARDGQLVQLARDSASMVLDKDPALSCDENKILLSQLQILKGNKEDWSLIS